MRTDCVTPRLHGSLLAVLLLAVAETGCTKAGPDDARVIEDVKARLLREAGACAIGSNTRTVDEVRVVGGKEEGPRTRVQAVARGSESGPCRGMFEKVMGPERAWEVDVWYEKFGDDWRASDFQTRRVEAAPATATTAPVAPSPAPQAPAPHGGAAAASGGASSTQPTGPAEVITAFLRAYDRKDAMGIARIWCRRGQQIGDEKVAEHLGKWLFDEQGEDYETGRAVVEGVRAANLGTIRMDGQEARLGITWNDPRRDGKAKTDDTKLRQESGRWCLAELE